MKISMLLGAALLAVTATTGAQAAAQADYRAGLSMTEGLPRLRVGSPHYDGPGTLDGDWTSGNAVEAGTFARDLTAQGPDGPVWGEQRGSLNMHRAGGPLNLMSETHSWVYALDNTAYGQSHVSYTGLNASGTLEGAGGEVNATSSWARGFSIAANTSFTFAALCTLDVLGAADPLKANTWFSLDPAASFASLTMADAAHRVGAQLTASLTSAFSSGLGDILSHSIGPGGLLSITVHNTTGSVMTGTLGASTYVSVSSAIPEPATVATLLLGLGLVGAAVRRRGLPR